MAFKNKSKGKSGTIAVTVRMTKAERSHSAKLAAAKGMSREQLIRSLLQKKGGHPVNPRASKPSSGKPAPAPKVDAAE